MMPTKTVTSEWMTQLPDELKSELFVALTAELIQRHGTEAEISIETGHGELLGYLIPSRRTVPEWDQLATNIPEHLRERLFTELPVNLSFDDCLTDEELFTLQETTPLQSPE